MKNPSSLNNQFGIDYAFPGLCSYCHTEIAEFQGSKEVVKGVFRPVLKNLKHNFRQTTFEMNENMMMNICLCDECSEGIEPKDLGYLMESEMRGWTVEANELLPDWPEEKKKRYLDDQYKLFITQRHNNPWHEDKIKEITKPDTEKFQVKDLKG